MCVITVKTVHKNELVRLFVEEDENRRELLAAFHRLGIVGNDRVVQFDPRLRIAVNAYPFGINFRDHWQLLSEFD